MKLEGVHTAVQDVLVPLDGREPRIYSTRPHDTARGCCCISIERDQDILHRRVHALELHVFNRSYPPPEEGLLRAAWPFTENHAERLATRVAILERAAMTIPVGVAMGWEVGETEHETDEEEE